MSATKAVQRIIVLALIAHSPPALAQQEKLSDYSSPKAVYDSFRDASQARAWARYLDCLTPAAQKSELWEVYFGCSLSSNKEGKRFVGTFIDDPKKLGEDYERNKEAKLRAIAAKGDKRALQEAMEYYSTAHNDLYVDAFFDHIPNKAGFYAAGRALLESDLASILGEFQGVVVRGDTATGTAKMTTFHLEGGGGEPTKKVADEDTKTFHFRKIDGKWLIDVPQ